MKRDQKLYDSAQIHTGLAANTEIELFQSPLGASTAQQTTGTVATYTKNDYHTNNILNGQLQKGQKIVVRGIKVWSDLRDVETINELFFDSQAVLQFWRGDDKAFQAPLADLINYGSSSQSQVAGGQKFSDVKPNIEGYLFKKWGITVEELKTFKVKIIFKKAVTFKAFNFDFGTLALNAAYTTAFHLFVTLDVEEEKN